MKLPTPLPIALGRFKQLPQRTNEVWQGGFVKLPVWIDNARDPAGRPYRPTGVLWVSLRTGLLHMALPDEDAAATPELALQALIEFGLKESKRLDGRPSVIEVRDAQLRDALGERLAALKTSVRQIEALPAVAEALRSLEAAAGSGERPAGLLEGAGVTVDQVRAFADAAATFYRAAPWRHLTNEDLIVVKAPRIPKGMRHVSVLGHGGEEFGIAFFDSRAAFERIYSRADAFLPARAVGVTYGPLHDLPFADVDAWEELGLPVADPHAYPLAADLAPNTMRRFDTTELRTSEAVLRALADTTEDELDSGSWRKVANTIGGAIEVELTLPFLLETERKHRSGPTLAVMQRLAEHTSGRLARLFENQAFESLDEANAAIERAQADGVLDGNAEEAARRPLNALEQAQEIAYDAMEATGRLRIKLARRALAVSPDCADACVILGDAAATAEEARDWYQRGVEAGARALGPEKFAEFAGSFWSHLETRPYMRAGVALAQALRDLGQYEDALNRFRELLRLNPDDNQGVRYLLLPALFERQRSAEVDELLRHYDGDMQAMWPYAQALRTFQAEGDTERARDVLATAVRANPHVVGYLLDSEAIPQIAPPHFALGSRDEAAFVAEHLAAAFDASPGAHAWIRRGARDRRGARGRRPKRSHTR
ncbi:MAG: DUF6930 domain-containing protein [Betaproteobacteria bacterium]